MNSIIKIRKRGIIAILALCILLGNAGTCLNVTATAEETIAAIEAITVVTEASAIATEETTAITEEIAPELMPMMANACDPNTYGTYAWNSLEAALNYYNMPADSVHQCNLWRNGIHYSYYVQMDSFRIYVRLA